MRAVYADMLTLFDSLVEVEGRHASRDELRLVHTPGYLSEVESWVEEAAGHGRPIGKGAELVVSGATWEASTAAVGCVLTGIDAVIEGRAVNAFCAVRPPARDAEPERAGRFGVLNQLAIGARYLQRRWGVGRVGILEWKGSGGIGSVEPIIGGDEGLTVARVTVPTSISSSDPAAGASRAAGSMGEAGDGTRENPAARDGLLEASHESLRQLQAHPVDFLLLSASFDGLPNDPVAPGLLHPSDFYEATELAREYAEAVCGGRLVSILEGGMDSAGTGAAVVQHLRALAGLEAAEVG